MISLIIAGGVALAAPSGSATEWPDINNHTLKGEVIPSSQVVTRTRWGTPMLPDGKGGYSLIAPINQEYIAQSLIIPPWNLPAGVTTQDVIFRPLPDVVEVTPAPADAAAPVAPAAPVEPAPAVDPMAPIDTGLPFQ